MITLLLVFVSVIFLDVVLSGDNAVVVGMAANFLPKSERALVIGFGIAGAAIIRILLSLLAVSLLQYRLISIIGGFALLIVVGRLLLSIWNKGNEEPEAPKAVNNKTFWTTVGLIVLADVSMSLDNVLAVASLARNNPVIMVLGLVCSIALLGVGAKIVSSLLDKFQWLNWVGVGLVFVIALELIFGIKAV